MHRSHSSASATCTFSTGLLILLAVLFLSLGLANLLTPLRPAYAQPDLELPDVADAGTWVTNGYVNSIATDGITTYIGGSFSRVGPNTGHGVIFNASSSIPPQPYLRINNTVNVAAVDGSGGWYVGGYFTGAGGMERNNIAHILPDGSLDTGWNPEVTGQVTSIAAAGGKVYIGGYFDSVNGQPRNYMAALDAVTGAVTAFNPNPNSTVEGIVADGSTVYAGGYFNDIGGQPRNYLAALDAVTGAATAWNPNPNSNVYSLALDGGIVYAGGGFGNIGGQPRNSLAALDATTGLATAWDPNPNGSVNHLVVEGAAIFASGSFSSIGGQSRNYLAALDSTTGLATAFSPSPNNSLESLAVDGSTVYAGGYFNNIGGQPRNRLAALDAVTGAATAWNPNPTDTVLALSAQGGKVFAGGYFNTVGGVDRYSLAALDASGQPTAWNPGADSTVETLKCADGLVYAGGYFSTIGGQPRNYLAALDATTGAATAWNPGADRSVFTIEAADGIIYAGGNFNNIGGQPRNYLAALDATTGAATSWNPSPSLYVYDLAVANGLVYAGGEFTTIGGQPRNYLAALDATGAATAFNPDADDLVERITVNGGLVYAGGFFTIIGGQTRYSIASLDAETGLATGWNPGADSFVSAMALRGDTVYAGGFFNYIGGNQRFALAAVDAAGNSTAWDPGKNEGYYGMGSLGEGSELREIGEAAAAPAEDKQAFKDALANGGSPRAGAQTKDRYGYGFISDMLFVGNTLYTCGYFGSIGYSSQGGIATFTGTPDTWYLAEGSTEGGMETWILVENPNAFKVQVDLAFDTEKGQVAPPELQGITLPVNSRTSFNLGTYLTTFHVSTRVTSHGGEVVCERALYGLDKSWGSSSVGTKAPNSVWYMPEGSTDGGMDTWVLVQNPNAFAVTMNVAFLTGSGEYLPNELQNYNLEPHRRVSIDVGEYVTSYDVSTRVVSDGGGVVCERSTYGPKAGEGDMGTWATSSMGAKGPSRNWYLAEGATDEGRQTWVLVENPYDLPVDVNVMFLTGQAEVQGPMETIPGKTRRSYNAGEYVTAFDVSTAITSTGGGVVCERAFYGDQRSWATSSTGSGVTDVSWNLAEGSTDGGMDTWIVVLNPQEGSATISLSFLTPEGLQQPPVLQDISVPPRTRYTLRINDYVINYDVSTWVIANSGVVCERSTYGPIGGEGATGSWATCSEGAY
jgi:hypothetical protein